MHEWQHSIQWLLNQGRVQRAAHTRCTQRWRDAQPAHSPTWHSPSAPAQLACTVRMRLSPSAGPPSKNSTCDTRSRVQLFENTRACRECASARHRTSGHRWAGLRSTPPAGMATTHPATHLCDLAVPAREGEHGGCAVAAPHQALGTQLLAVAACGGWRRGGEPEGHCGPRAVWLACSGLPFNRPCSTIPSHTAEKRFIARRMHVLETKAHRRPAPSATGTRRC